MLDVCFILHSSRFIGRLWFVAGVMTKQDLTDGVNGAVRTAVDVLGLVASATKNVPYLGIISGALEEVLKIRDVRLLTLIYTAALMIVTGGSIVQGRLENHIS
jgi:hypothetical protein